MESLALPETHRQSALGVSRIAADLSVRGGVTLWKKQGTNFSVVVFQLHDEVTTSSDPTIRNLNQADYDMIEIRVLSAQTDLKGFWKPSVKRLTHWKKSWILSCTNPKKTLADFKTDVSGVRSNFLSYDRYEKEVDKAIENAEATFESLSKLTPKKPTVAEKPWATAVRTSTGDERSDRYWVAAVYPDGEYWAVRVNRGMMKSFGFKYPASWENGYVFESFKKADEFAKQKMRAQLDEGYAPLTDPKTLRILKWSLQHVEEGS